MSLNTGYPSPRFPTPTSSCTTLTSAVFSTQYPHILGLTSQISQLGRKMSPHKLRTGSEKPSAPLPGVCLSRSHFHRKCSCPKKKDCSAATEEQLSGPGRKETACRSYAQPEKVHPQSHLTSQQCCMEELPTEEPQPWRTWVTGWPACQDWFSKKGGQKNRLRSP